MFFVESLAASFIGLEMLARIVTMVQDLGHEVQLHLHTEWLNWKNRHLFLADRGRFLRSFSIDEQTDLIGRAVENLQKCGARHGSSSGQLWGGQQYISRLGQERPVVRYEL